MVTQLLTMKRIDIGSLGLGTILCFKGYSRDGERWAVIANPINQEHTIANLEDGRKSTIYPGSPKTWEEHAGIGYYFPKVGTTTHLTNLELQELIVLSEQYELLSQQRRDFEQQMREEYTALTKKWFEENVPPNVNSFIVGEFWEEDPENNGQYIAARTILLAFSYDNRDLISQMRQAALNFPSTTFLSEDNIELVQQSTTSNDQYLGTDSITGWKIKRIFLSATPSYLEFTFVLNDESIHLNPPPSTSEKGSITFDLKLESDNSKHNMFIENYSEKSFVVRGETKPYKDQLGRNGLNGKFNKFLTDKNTNQKFAGWIFPMTRKNEVEKFLSTLL